MSVSATMRNTGITHAVSKHVDFYFYAHTKCLVRVDWEEAFDDLVSLDKYKDAEKVKQGLGRRTDKEVDCMACISAESVEDRKP
jgi:hypothetical protein